MPNTIKLMQQKFKNMIIKPIKNRKDYQQSLDRLEIIFDAKKGSSEGDELKC